MSGNRPPTGRFPDFAPPLTRLWRLHCRSQSELPSPRPHAPPSLVPLERVALAERAANGGFVRGEGAVEELRIDVP